MKIWFVVIFMAISGSLFAQNYNLGFEEWDSSLPPGFNSSDSCFFPINASAINSENLLNQWTAISPGICRTTDAHSGNYAAVVFMWYNGSMGRLSLGQGCDNPNTADKEICKNHFSSKIYGISGYYKYIVDSFMPNDTYHKKVTAHIKTYKVDTITGTLELLSNDSLIYQRADVYQSFQLAINYPDSTSSPDSVSIWFESQGYGSGTTSCGFAHFLYLDDLEFHFSPMTSTSIKENPLKKKLKIFPNPASGKINIEYVEGLKILQIQLTSTAGKTLRTFSPHQKQLDITGISAGNYFLRVVSNDGEITKQIAIY